jgi:prepilin-type processing-associated H-X9-DG protein
MANALNFSMGAGNGPSTSFAHSGVANSTAANTIISVLLCPSDRGQKIDTSGLASTNYAINIGSGLINNGLLIDPANPANNAVSTPTPTSTAAPDGISYQVSAVGPAAVTDGTSRTLAFGESLTGPDDATTQPIRFQGVKAQYMRDANMACVSDPTSTSIWYNDRFNAWVKGTYGGAAMTFFLPPNATQPDCMNTILDQARMGPRSNHPGGTNALFCDGHVQFLKDSISVNVMRGLATRAGGEVIGDDAS